MSFREARIRAGLRQVDIAKAMQVTQPTVSNWDTGIVQPHPRRLIHLAEVCNCSIEDLLRPEEVETCQP